MTPSVTGPAPGEPDPERRLRDLEGQVKELKRKPKDIWDILQSLSGLMSGVMVAVVGFFLTGSVNRALQERQFQFSSAKDMQELLTKLNDPKTTADDKESTALVLAVFGKYAIAPLINQLQSEDANRAVAAEIGLRAIGYAEPANTCRELIRVLENRTAIFAWHTHLSSIRLMRDTGCVNAAPAIEQYRDLLKSPDYRRIVREQPAPTPENVDELQQAIAGALRVLPRSPH